MPNKKHFFQVALLTYFNVGKETKQRFPVLSTLMNSSNKDRVESSRRNQDSVKRARTYREDSADAGVNVNAWQRLAEPREANATALVGAAAAFGDAGRSSTDVLGRNFICGSSSCGFFQRQAHSYSNGRDRQTKRQHT